MNPLREAIQLMTKEEVRAFKLFAQKVSTQGPRKDIELFDAIRKSREDYEEEAVFARIYPDAPKNTFHRLKSRLLHDINRSMVDLHLEDNDTLKLWHFLSVVGFYLSRRHFDLAHWFLRKAENLAEKLSHNEALDIIYGSYIRLSLEVGDINPEPFIAKRRDNQRNLQQLRLLDDVLAASTYRIKVAQTWGEGGGALMDMLAETVRDFEAQHEGSLSVAARTRLFQAVSSLLIDKRDYVALERYVSESHAQFEAEGLFGRNTHDTKLLMLAYHANALHKIGQYEASLKQAELLGRAMKDYDSFLQDKYMFFFYNALLVNYFKLDLDKSLQLLDEMGANEKLIGSPFNMLFVQMNQGLVWRDKGNFRKAIRHIVQVVNGDAYRAAAPGLQLRISVAELMIRLDLREYDVLEMRLKQFQADFGELLSRAPFARERALAAILALVARDGDHRSKAVQAAIDQFLRTPANEEDKDAELIAYDEYLRELQRA